MSQLEEFIAAEVVETVIDGKAAKIKDLITSHSIDMTYESCPRRFEFSHIYNVSPYGGESGFAADTGTALHEAIQAWARIYLTGGEWEDAVNAGYLALLQWWPWVSEEIGLEEKKQTIQTRSLNRAILVFHNAIESPFWNDWELAQDSDGKLCIEVPWRIVHESKPMFQDHNGVWRRLVSQGKIDFVLRHKKQRDLYRVADTKTTVKPVQSHRAAFRFSGQGPGYGIVLGEVLGLPWREEGLDVTFMISEFGLQSEYPPAMRTEDIHVSPSEIEDYLRVKDDRLNRMIEWGRQGWWPRKQSGCDSFGAVCPFFSCCHRRDSGFLKKWLAFSDLYQESHRIYDTIWELTA